MFFSGGPINFVPKIIITNVKQAKQKQKLKEKMGRKGPSSVVIWNKCF